MNTAKRAAYSWGYSSTPLNSGNKRTSATWYLSEIPWRTPKRQNAFSSFSTQLECVVRGVTYRRTWQPLFSLFAPRSKFNVGRKNFKKKRLSAKLSDKVSHVFFLSRTLLNKQAGKELRWKPGRGGSKRHGLCRGACYSKCWIVFLGGVLRARQD